MFLKFREDFEWTQIPKLRLLRCPKFSQSFSPLRFVGFCPWLATGCGSRGKTPLHIAARGGHESAVPRLLEAKAALDAKDEDGRGLEEDLVGKPHEALKMLMVY